MNEYQLSNGEKFWIDEYWIFFERNGEMDYSSPQTLARDRRDYRYTHGGSIYREACEIVWRERREKK